VQRIEAATVAVRFTPSGSTLEQQAREKLRNLQEPEKPFVPTQQAARSFVQKFGKT